MRWVPIVSSPVLSGRVRTNTPSFTCRRKGHRAPQLTMQALHTVASASAMPSATCKGVSGVGGLAQALVPTSTPVPATAPDHWSQRRRLIWVSTSDMRCLRGVIFGYSESS